MIRSKLLRLTTSLAALALVGTACAGERNPPAAKGATPTKTVTETKAAPAATKVPATELRAGLTRLLTEHVYLASLATDSALRGDTAGFQAYATALNGPTNSNSSDIVAAIGSVYGPEVQKAFDGLWRSNGHIPAFVAYTQAVAKDDGAGADKAVNDLLAYAKTFGTTMNQVNSNLPADAVEDAIKMHATTLKSVIDAQKAKDAVKTASDLREATSHMGDTAKVLADATAKKFPDKFRG